MFHTLYINTIILHGGSVVALEVAKHLKIYTAQLAEKDKKIDALQETVSSLTEQLDEQKQYSRREIQLELLGCQRPIKRNTLKIVL